MFASIFVNEISLQPSSLCCYLLSGLFSFVNELEGLLVLERLWSRHPQNLPSINTRKCSIPCNTYLGSRKYRGNFQGQEIKQELNTREGSAQAAMAGGQGGGREKHDVLTRARVGLSGERSWTWHPRGCALSGCGLEEKSPHWHRQWRAGIKRMRETALMKKMVENYPQRVLNIQNSPVSDWKDTQHPWSLGNANPSYKEMPTHTHNMATSTKIKTTK